MGGAAKILTAGLLLLAAAAPLAGEAFWRAESGRREEGREESRRETLYVFGTLVEIEIYGEPPEKADRAIAEIAREFDRLHVDWHAWRPGGALGRLNAAIAAGRSLEVDPELAGLLRRGQTLAAASGELFEPAIGGLIAAWGFHEDEPPTGPAPSAAEIERWVRARPRMSDLVIEGTLVRSRNPMVRIDLGGFAKGAALDLAAARLRRLGVRNAVLNAGGDLNVLGAHGARPWRVAIRDPFAWGAVAAIELRPGEALYTSGNYERYLEQDGERFSHIIDPRTGRPVREIVSASVLGADGALADAAATALSVAGPEGWLETARAMGVEAALLIDAEGVIRMTPAMAARASLLREGAAVIVADPTKPRPAVEKEGPRRNHDNEPRGAFP